MARYIFFALLAVPLLEIGVFIEVGGGIGLWPTLAIVVATAVAGTALLRHQGVATLARARASMRAGQPPLAELFDAVCLAVAGLLLLTPGFLTDIAGAALFVPRVRAWLRLTVVRRLGGGPTAQAPPPGQDPGAGPVIDGDYREIERDS